MTRQELAKAIGSVFDQFPNDPLPIEVVMYMTIHNLRLAPADHEAGKKVILDFLQEDESYSVVVIRQKESGEYKINPLKKR